MRIYVLFLIAFSPAAAIAQQTTIGGGLSGVGSSFYEQSGVGFNFSGPNFFFRQNSFGLATPPFGGYDPGAGATFGFGGPVGNGNAAFNFNFGQGSSTTMTSQSPSVTMMNGGTGVFSAGTWTPFVAGAVPVVGDANFGGGNASVLNERLSRLPHEPKREVSGASETLPEPKSAHVASSADQPAVGVARIRQTRAMQHAAEEQIRTQEINALVARADAAIADRKFAVARLYLQQAARRSSGEQRDQLEQRATSLSAGAREF